jgi:hypothetical protein
VPRKQPIRHRVGDIIQVRLYPSGQIVEAEIKAIVEQTTGRKYQVSSGHLSALVSPDQIVDEG